MLISLLVIGTSSCGEKTTVIVAPLPPAFSAEFIRIMKVQRALMCADPSYHELCEYNKWAYKTEMKLRALHGKGKRN
jgi:hypothetical protein